MSSTGNTWLYLLLLAIGAAASGPKLSGAELRTSVGNRPVRRSVEPAAHTTTIVQEEFVETDEYLGGSGCDECSGRHDQGCQLCQTCCFRSCGVWAEAEFLMAWRHGIRFPPLVTTATAGTAANVAGVLNQPTTTIVYPTDPVGEDGRPGGRIAVGAWLDPWQCWGAEARYFILADEQTQFNASSTGAPILARPFFDLVAGASASRLIAFPGVVTPGSITITTESEVMGGDALLRRALYRWEGGRVDLLVGYQFARIDETLVIADSSTDADPANLIADGTIFAITDSFATQNEYHAASFGAAGQFEQGDWRLDLLAKIGLGNMRETVQIAGQSIVDAPPVGVVDAVTQTGLLAQGVNLGSFSQDRFAVSPEVNARVSYHVSECIDVWAGYTFVYWSRVAEPGRQIDPDLRVPTDRFAIRDSEYWIHALTLGGQVKF